MNVVDDITLIHKFVQGETELWFNHNLRIETACKKILLMSKNGNMLANVDEASNFQSFLVNGESRYWELINKVLLEHHLMPISSTQNGWTRYEYCPIPDNYTMNFTEARVLWRNWRNYQYQQVKKGVCLSLPNLLIATSQS
ncbi:MAG: hypothetical protein QNJ51_17545 [Calothrix sp. MO_167.B12]|nr:hypothetical protein [Calothrix sp. MO_167.B12]